MRRLFPYVRVLVAVTVAVVGLSLSQPPLVANPTAFFRAACGVERWPVKTLSDADVGLVDFTAVPTTVEELIAFPAPEYRPQNSRVAPVELTTYTIVANLIAAKLEPDSDIHLVISALTDDNQTMIVEFPDGPNCAPDTDQELVNQMQAARDAFIAAFGVPPSSYFKQLSGEAQITGIGFFDRIHGQHGVAPNGIELHPVLNFQSPVSRKLHGGNSRSNSAQRLPR